MKTPSADLFDLIQKLTPSEKKFFRQWSDRHVIGQENSYLRIYDCLVAQATYDEKAVIAAFAGTAVARHFAVYKQKVYEKICEALYWFHAAADVADMVRRDLQVVKVLLDKHLPDQAKRLLRRCRKQIDRYELLELMPSYLLAQRNYWLTKGLQNGEETDLDELLREEEVAAQRLLLHARFWHTGSQVARLHTRQLQPTDAVQLSQLKNWLQAPWLATPEPELPRRVLLEKWSMLARYYFMTQQPDQAYHYNQQQLALMEANSPLVRLYPRRYVAVFHNLLIDSFATQQFAVLEQRLAQWLALPKRLELQRMPELPQRTAELGLLLQLNLLKVRANWAEVVEQWPQLLDTYAKVSHLMPVQRRLSCQYLLAYLSFRLRKWDDSLAWQQHLLQAGGRQVAGPLYDHVLILQLLTHYQLGHYDFLAYRLEAVRRHFAGNPTPGIALKYLRRLVNAPNSARPQLLQAWWTELPDEASDQQTYFPFREWLAEELKLGRE